MSHRSRKPAGRYGVLVGKIKDGQIYMQGKSPHYQIWVQSNIAGATKDYRIAVNVLSEDESEVLAYFDPNFTAATKLNLPLLASGAQGYRDLSTGVGGQGLDYIRDKLFPLDQMAPIPPEGTGVTLANLLDAQVERAKADAAAIVISCGEYYSDAGADPIFGFTPQLGIHDIHMMQGNPAGDFSGDNRVNGDGALFIRFTQGETVVLFTRFSTQSLSTDNNTGAPANA